MTKTTRRTAATAIAGLASVLIIALVLIAPASAAAQTPKGPGAPPENLKVFLDWPGADLDIFRGEIPFVEFVSSRDAAQVHVVVTSEAADAGQRYTLTFAGLGRFARDHNTLTYVGGPSEKPEETRLRIAGLLKIGLVRYIAKTPQSKFVSIGFQEKVKPTSVVDPWRFWVFNLGFDGFLMGESQYASGSYSGSFSANRVTPEFKIRTSVYGNIQRQRFDVEGTSIISSSTSAGFDGLAVKSLGEHWSAGISASLQSSTYSNVKFGLSLAPAVEYDVFRYSESTKRQLRILYRVGYTKVRYVELTLYDKLAQSLFRESLSVTLDVKRPWGTIDASLEGSHYFYRPAKYRVEFTSSVALRVWRGLNLRISGGASKINDQLSLVKGGLTPEEILLQLRELETDYSYYVSVGLDFTFGSLRSNVVNPRFGNAGRSVSISF